MVDSNNFKKLVKVWIKENPNGSEQDLLDFCEEIVPQKQYAASQWLIDQTLSWYRHILVHRDIVQQGYEDVDDVA